MKFAIVEGQRTDAKPKVRGTCQNCGSDMISKCGKIKMWHWAHKGKPPCDPWWESETEWHRNWKDKFPKEWQEVIHLDPKTGEKHIADVKNPFGLVIEFQHSTLDFNERKSREEFYKDLVWVVDGNRGGLDESYFNMGLSGPIQKNPLAYRLSWMGQSQFIRRWSESSVKVYIDFGKEVLWRLVMYNHETKNGAVGPIRKDAFIEYCKTGLNIGVSYIE